MSKHKPRLCIVIPADDTLPLRVIPDQSCELKALQALVGGYIERAWCEPRKLREFALTQLEVVLQKGAQMYVNEEGLLNKLPSNARASAVYEGPLGHWMGIVGDAFIMAVP